MHSAAISSAYSLSQSASQPVSQENTDVSQCPFSSAFPFLWRLFLVETSEPVRGATSVTVVFPIVCAWHWKMRCFVGCIPRWSKGRTEGDPSQSNQMLGPDYLLGTQIHFLPMKSSEQNLFGRFRLRFPVLLLALPCWVLLGPAKARTDGNYGWTDAEADTERQPHRHLRELSDAASYRGGRPWAARGGKDILIAADKRQDMTHDMTRSD